MRMMIVCGSAQRRRQLLDKQMQLKFPRISRGRPIPVCISICSVVLTSNLFRSVLSFSVTSCSVLML